MNDRLTILLLTYNRYDYAERALKSILDKVSYSKGPLGVHIADDGSPDDYVDKLKFIASCYDKIDAVTCSVTERRGYGGNYNRATHSVHNTSGFVFPLEDDWELTRELDLDPFVQDLKDSQFGMIRMGYVGWTQELKAQFVGINGRMYLHLLPESPELHIFSGHPRLETVSWARNVGLWPEFCSPGDAEIAVSFRKEARHNVLWPLWANCNCNLGIFQHFGGVKSEWG